MQLGFHSSKLSSSCLDKLRSGCLLLHLFPFLAGLFIFNRFLITKCIHNWSYYEPFCGLKLKIYQDVDHTSEPCGKNPLIKPKDWYAPNAGIWQMSWREQPCQWRLLQSLLMINKGFYHFIYVPILITTLPSTSK